MEKKDFIAWARTLAAGYMPNDTVRQQLSQIDLIALVGPTGVGKTTILEQLSIPHVLSDVTREPRDGEKDGQEYYFRTDFDTLIKEMKAGEFAQFLVARSNEFYGTRGSTYPASGPASMAVVAGAIESFRTLGFRKVVPIYILPPSYVEWMRRIGVGRAVDFEARMAEARESLILAMKDPTYVFVLNDDLKLAVAEVENIIAGGEVDEHRKGLARESADQLFGRLGVDDEFLA